MKENRLFRLLEDPRLYRLGQRLLAPGADKLVLGYSKELLGLLPLATRLVDVGCGPSSWLWAFGLHPVGVDISPAYSKEFRKTGEPAITASADRLPFATRSFDCSWSIGMLHHLPDDLCQSALAEMVRVVRPGGYVVIVDAVLPEPAWRHLTAYAIRRLDRGRYIRTSEGFKGLLPERAKWTVNRRRYSYNGLEILVCSQILVDQTVSGVAGKAPIPKEIDTDNAA